MRVAWLVLVGAMLAGCGSGGGTAASVVTQPPDSQHVSTPTTATVIISTRGPSNDTVVYGVACKLDLPAGVTVPADSDGAVLTEALTATIGGAAASGRYQPATATDRGFVEIHVYSTGGFTVGGLASLTVTVPTGAPATADGFTMEGFTVKDANGAVMIGITPLWAVQVP